MAIRWWWFHHWSCMKSQLLLDSYHSTVAGNQCFDVVDLVWLKWAENLRVVCLDVGYDFYKAPSHWSNAVGEKQNGLSCIFCLKWYFLKFFCHCVFLTFAGPNSWRWIIHFATSIVTGGVYVCVCVCVWSATVETCGNWGLCHPRPKDMKGQWDHDPSPENGIGGT